MLPAEPVLVAEALLLVTVVCVVMVVVLVTVVWGAVVAEELELGTAPPGPATLVVSDPFSMYTPLK